MQYRMKAGILLVGVLLILRSELSGARYTRGLKDGNPLENLLLKFMQTLTKDNAGSEDGVPSGGNNSGDAGGDPNGGNSGNNGGAPSGGTSDGDSNNGGNSGNTGGDTSGFDTTNNELSVEEMVSILNKHNQLRAQEGSSNMEILRWSNELADKAQELADTCHFDHDIMTWPGSTYPKVGQNLYIGPQKDLHRACQSWYDEKKDYLYGQDPSCKAGKVCGHYTQLVWAESREVGCASHFCKNAPAPKFGRTYHDVYYIACNYGPAGNMGGVVPFLHGSPCSYCEGESQWCTNDLCASKGCSSESDCHCAASCQNGGTKDRNTCSCSCADGFRGPTCSEPCEDPSDCDITKGIIPTFCTNPDTAYVIKKCPLMCNQCVPAGGNVCQDKDERCGKNPGWPAFFCDMDENIPLLCPKLCGRCNTKRANEEEEVMHIL